MALKDTMPSLVEKQLIYLEKIYKKWTLNLLLHMLVLSRDLDIALTLLLQRNQSQMNLLVPWILNTLWRKDQ